MAGRDEDLNPTFKEAKRRSDWLKWEEAIRVELRSLEANKMWSVVERPKDANVVSSKWVLRIEKNSAGEVEKYKARLVARGFTQIQCGLLQDICTRCPTCIFSNTPRVWSTETVGLTPSILIRHI